MHNKRYTGACMGTLVVICFCISSDAASIFTDGIVASVAGEPILQSDIMQEIMPRVQGINTGASSQEEIERQIEPIFREALEQAIEHFILYREAQTLGVQIPDDEVEKRINEIRSQYESAEIFQRAIESAGYTLSDFRDRMRRQMMAITVSITKQRQFEREAVISESEMAEYYQDNLEAFSYPARYRTRRIFLQSAKDEEARTAAREKLSGLIMRIQNGEDFADIARENSDGPEAKEGGMMGWVRPGDLVEPLDGALAALSVGEISEILETEFGIHVLRLEEVEDKGVVPYAEARTEIEPLLRARRGDERYRQWMSTLRKRSNVRVFI